MYRTARCITACADIKTWAGREALGYHGLVDLILTDPPWNVLPAAQGGSGSSKRSDDRVDYSIPSSNVLCSYVHNRLLCECRSCTSLIFRTLLPALPSASMQRARCCCVFPSKCGRFGPQLFARHCWYITVVVFERDIILLHYHVQTVEKAPLVVAKDPSRCGQTQSGWAQRTSSCYFYIVAHKNSGAGKFYWNKTASRFLVKNLYPVTSSVCVCVCLLVYTFGYMCVHVMFCML